MNLPASGSGADLAAWASSLLHSLYAAVFVPKGWWPILDAVATAHVVFGAASAFVTGLVWVERKVSAHMQSRIGPKRVGPFGLLQPLADVIKLTLKQVIAPLSRDRFPYFWAPVVAFLAAFMALVVVPFDEKLVVADLNIGFLYIVAVTGFSAIGILMAGWSSHNKFSLLGGFRSAAQIVSYEVPLVLSVIPVVMTTGTLSLHGTVEYQRAAGFWFIVPQFVAFLTFLAAATAEANRAPFDIPEAESELIGGFHTEYSGVKFAMFFLGEYIAVIVSSAVAVAIFWGGWLAPPFLSSLPVPGYAWFLLKLMLVILLVMAFRWTFPRLRVDQLMDFGWKVLIPLTVANILVTGVVLLLLDSGVHP